MIRTLLQKYLHRLKAPSYIHRNDRWGALHRAWGHVFTNHLRGGYYEFGIYRGETFRASYRVYQEFRRWLQRELSSPEVWRREQASQHVGYQHHFYAFDTFSGIPDNEESAEFFRPGTHECSFKEFSRLNQKVDIIENDHIRYFQGTFANLLHHEIETLLGLQPAAIVNLDCDLYASARDALEIVAPKLLQGSVLLMDDYNVFAADPQKGERKALREFIERYPNYSIEPWFSYHYAGQAFLVHKG